MRIRLRAVPDLPVRPDEIRAPDLDPGRRTEAALEVGAGHVHPDTGISCLLAGRAEVLAAGAGLLALESISFLRQSISLVFSSSTRTKVLTALLAAASAKTKGFIYESAISALTRRPRMLTVECQRERASWRKRDRAKPTETASASRS